MRRAAIVLLAWGLWLGALSAVQAIFAPPLIQFAMPAAAVTAALAAGLVLWRLERGGARTEEGARVEEPRLISDSSYATATLVVGIAIALLGSGFGLWLILVGVGIGALGLGGIVREQRARGRLLRGPERR